jgi:hypothetical protein
MNWLKTTSRGEIEPISCNFRIATKTTESRI